MTELDYAQTTLVLWAYIVACLMWSLGIAMYALFHLIGEYVCDG